MRKAARPAISVIMSIYNQKCPERLNKAVMSILHQSFTDFEFIIYDDGSDKEVTDRLRQYAKLDDRVLFISNPVNHGLAYSLNTCIDVASGKYLARMDDDDISSVNRLQIQYDFMEKHPEIAFSGCNAMLIDEKGIWGYRKMPEFPDEKHFLKFSPFIHPTVIVRREVFEQGNTYNHSKDYWRCEDYELFMRLWKLGFKGQNLQEELFYYREERASYAKRKLRYRMDEMKLRYRNFKELGILFPLGWLYALRPVAAAMIPSNMIWKVKKLYHRRDMIYEDWKQKEEKSIPEHFKENPTII